MYCSLVVKGRVVPRERQTVRRQQQHATPAATAGGGGIPDDERRHDRPTQALHLSGIGTTRRCRRSPDSQVKRSPPPSQAGRPSGDVRFELPGHSGENRVGLAPTSRFCIAVASVAADHEAVQRDIVDDARRLGEPQGHRRGPPRQTSARSTSTSTARRTSSTPRYTTSSPKRSRMSRSPRTTCPATPASSSTITSSARRAFA